MAQAAPQIALGIATSGTSIPFQAALGGVAQGAQTLAEGGDVGEAGVTGTLAGLGQGVGGVVGKAVAPAAKHLNRAAIEAAKRLGITLPASAQSTSRFAQYVEGAGSKMLGGQRIIDRAADATEALAAKGDDLAAVDRGAIGDNLAGALDSFKRGWTTEKNAAFQAANLKGVKVTPQKTLAAIDQKLADPTLDRAAAAYLQRVRNLIAPTGGGAASVGGGKPATGVTSMLPPGSTAMPRDATEILRAVRKLQDKGQSYLSEPWAQRNKGLFREVAATLADDLDAGVGAADPALLSAYQKAKDIYIKGAKVRESGWAKDIGRLAASGQTDKIASRVFKPSMSVRDIPKIMDTLGPQVADDVRSSVLADLVKAGTSGRNFTPKSLERAVKNWGPDKLKTILSPEQWQQIQDMVEVSRSFGQMNRIQQGSPTAGLANVMGMFYSPVVALRTLMGEAAFGKFIGSDVGQRWLTTGIMPNAGKATSGALRGATGFGAGRYREDVDRARQLRELQAR